MSAGDTYDGLRSVTEFTVTDDHLKLLRRAYVSWDDCEFGAPEIDCKRPYGNSSVIEDIAEILGTPEDQWRGEDEEVLPDAEEAFTRLHGETAVVLQIALATGEFRTGRYVSDKYSANWRLADLEPQLPAWADLSELDKGAALLFLSKQENEGTEYAIENYPARFFDHPALTALSPRDASEHAASFGADADALPFGDYERLYELALTEDRKR